ncbi:MAG TPA: DegT/DnrJ/EryC1/StrS family aminotransferase [Conexibacter sp.]|nr:DegT/DnrJ/EryC1/StrS family aminotransferase [Conexibacter sp.]
MLRLADPRFGGDALAAVGRVLASGHLTQGPMVEQFERAIADFCGVAHAVATTSATTAIELSLAALDVGPGDEVVAADFTYPATGNAVLQRGATLRLADVDPQTYCVAPDALEALLGPRTKAVLTVDVFGLPADYRAIEPLLVERGVALVCDAACGLGGAIGERRVGAFGALSCFSFHPRKSLTTGEGGMVTTDDDALAARLRRLRNHGAERAGWRATFVEPGFNYRMSDLNAALGVVQVPHHAATVRRRGELAARLTGALADVPGVRPQRVPDGFLHPYQAFVVVLDERIDRDALIPALREQGVESTLGTYAMHAEPAFQRACGTRPGDLPASHALLERTLALPLHERLADNDVVRIADALRAAIAPAPPTRTS